MTYGWRAVLLIATCAGSLACTEPAKAPTSAPCTLLITGATLQYDGRALPLPGPVEKWEEVLGPSSRRVEVADTVHVWDRVGLHAFGRDPGSVLQGFFVLLKPRSDPDRPAPDYWPHTPFKGRLCVDGSEISSGTRIADVNRSKRGPKFSKGYLDTIYSYDLTAPAAVYVRLDLADKESPESFSMSLAEEDGRRAP